jgi:hypothetical protein
LVPDEFDCWRCHQHVEIEYRRSASRSAEGAPSPKAAPAEVTSTIRKTSIGKTPVGHHHAVLPAVRKLIAKPTVEAAERPAGAHSRETTPLILVFSRLKTQAIVGKMWAQDAKTTGQHSFESDDTDLVLGR